MNNYHFDNQYNTYHSSSSCIAPEGRQVSGPPGKAGKLANSQDVLVTHEHACRHSVPTITTMQLPLSMRSDLYNVFRILVA